MCQVDVVSIGGDRQAKDVWLHACVQVAGCYRTGYLACTAVRHFCRPNPIHCCCCCFAPRRQTVFTIVIVILFKKLSGVGGGGGGDKEEGGEMFDMEAGGAAGTAK